jgi:hypothetical protein
MTEEGKAWVTIEFRQALYHPQSLHTAMHIASDPKPIWSTPRSRSLGGLYYWRSTKSCIILGTFLLWLICGLCPEIKGFSFILTVEGPRNLEGGLKRLDVD